MKFELEDFESYDIRMLVCLFCFVFCLCKRFVGSDVVELFYIAIFRGL